MIVFDHVTLSSVSEQGPVLVDVSEQFGTGTVSIILGGAVAERLILKAIIGFVTPTRGAIRVAGLEVGARPMMVRQRMTYVPKRSPLLSHLRITEQVGYLGALTGHRFTKRQIVTGLRLCGVPDRLMTQRTRTLNPIHRLGLWLAVCRLRQSPILLMEDPTDDLTRAQVSFATELIRELASPDRCVLIASRDESFANDVADIWYRIDREKFISGRITRGPWPEFATAP